MSKTWEDIGFWILVILLIAVIIYLITTGKGFK